MAEKKARIARAAALTAAAWPVAIVLAPGLARSMAWLAAVPYAIGALVCHQLPDRSFHLWGAQLPVCARCTGLYAGAALGLAAWVAAAGRRGTWPRESAIKALAIGSAPTAVTVATAWLGIADPPNAWRAALALPLGAIAGRVVGAVLTDHLK